MVNFDSLHVAVHFGTFVYSRSHWVFGLRPSSGILKTNEHNDSEAQVRGEATPTLLDPLERANLNH
jgi:hypothetical protein